MRHMWGFCICISMVQCGVSFSAWLVQVLAREEAQDLRHRRWWLHRVAPSEASEVRGPLPSVRRLEAQQLYAGASGPKHFTAYSVCVEHDALCIEANRTIVS